MRRPDRRARRGRPGRAEVVPGSNALEDKLTFGPDDCEPAEMSRGSVLFSSGSVYRVAQTLPRTCSG